MARRLSFSVRATADLNQIWDYTEARWSREQAYRYVSAIVARCRAALAADPVVTERIVHNVRYLRVRTGSHLAFLRETSDRLIVVRVLHVRQDANAALR